MLPIQIIEMIAEKRMVTYNQLRKVSKEKKFYWPRKECYYIIKQIYNSMTIRDIGMLFNRKNVAQVSREINSVKIKVQSDPVYRDIINKWINDIKQKL